MADSIEAGYHQQAIIVIYVREAEDLEQDETSRGGQKGWDSECMLKVDLEVFADGLGLRYKRQIGDKDYSKVSILNTEKIKCLLRCETCRYKFGRGENKDFGIGHLKSEMPA